MFKALSGLSSGSSDHAHLQLAPTSEPICSTEIRFCLPHPVTLSLREKVFSFTGDDFNIQCATTGTPYFKCKGRAFSLREKKVLRDTYNTPVANFKEKLFSFNDSFDIYSGDNSDRKICKCSSSFTFLKAKMHAHFQDVVTGAQRTIVLKGDWRDKRCVVYLGDPKHGGVPIAKIFRPYTVRSIVFDADAYNLEIAPGVDVALMVILCIAFDEHARD